MTKFMVKLRASGYSRSQRWEILKSGSKRFNRMVEDEKRGIRRVNRPRWEGGGKRYVGKLLRKKNWYKKKKEGSTEKEQGIDKGKGGVYKIDGGGKTEIERGTKEEKDPETVMFIPSTPRGGIIENYERNRY